MAGLDSDEDKEIFDSRRLFSVLDPAIRTAFLVFVLWLFIAVFFDLLRYLGSPSSENSISRVYVTKVVDFLPLSGYLRELPEKIAGLDLRFHQLIKIAFIPLALGLLSITCFDSFRIPKKLWRFVKLQMSDNYTVFLFASVTFFVVVALNGREYLWSLQLVFLFGAFLLMIGIVWLFFSEEGDVKNSKFLSDRALGEDGKSAVDNDELGMKEDAAQFAKSVLNNGSDVPMVFGIDAPWGSGKSSYLALCREQAWDVAPGVVVFHFNPTLYDLKRQDLFDAFSNELVATLRKNNVRVRRIRMHLRKLARLFKGSSIQFFGLTLALGEMQEASVEDVKNDLRKDIQRSGKHIIAIIDDLDRLYLEDVKDMLGIVRNVFNISGVSFVLCYDSETVNSFEFEWKRVHRYSSETALNSEKSVPTESVYESHEPNNQAINAYFEKMVQVKKTLLPRRDRLEQYFKREIDKLFGKESLHGGKFLVALADFFRDEELTSYGSYLFDIRKLKRIINYIELSELYRKDLDDYDFDAKILIKLIVLYVNFPNTFRRIYVFETMANEGNNSLSWAFLEENAFYDKRTRVYGNESQKTADPVNDILKNLLDISKRNETRVGGDDLKARKKENRLEIVTGLHVIADGQFPSKYTQQRFSDKWVGDLSNLDEIFNIADYFSDRELSEEERRALIARARDSRELHFDVVTKLIRYILENIVSYSLVNDSGIYAGKRRDLVYEILFLLDKRGWKDENEESFNNSDENVAQIAPRILDEFDGGPGILSRLIVPVRGALGIFDAIVLYSGCVSARESFNLQRALERYEKNEETGAMPFMARQIFRAFREQYIQPKRNIIAEIEAFPDSAWLGAFTEPIHKAFAQKKESIEEELDRIRRIVIGRIIWVLASDKDQSIGLCKPDSSEQEKSISQEVRQYLFEVCFSLGNRNEGAEAVAKTFVNYLLAGFKHDYSNSRQDDFWTPMAKDYASILGKNELTAYWVKNGKRIKEISRKWDSETRVHTYNYTAIYRDDLEPLFKELDKLLESKPVSVDSEIV